MPRDPSTIMHVTGATLYLLPVRTRVPLKFGTETLETVTVARVHLRVRNERGERASGWGESPLSVQWGWPSALSYDFRHRAMQELTQKLGAALLAAELSGHALEIGHAFQEQILPGLTHNIAKHGWPSLLAHAPQDKTPAELAIPHLAALLCLAPWDLALHDAYGNLVNRDVYQTYNHDYLEHDLASYLTPAAKSQVHFAGKFPADYLVSKAPTQLRAWHLVGGLDPLEPSDLRGDEPSDGYPVLLGDWIKRDGLTCLKIKLRGNDAAWDYERIVRVGKLALPLGVEWLTTDFNCTVTDPEYVNAILDRLRDAEPHLYGTLLYVEQPFPYELHEHPIDVHSVAARKPLFLDESAHDWQHIALGRELGWTGVALKTCKTQAGALLGLCWAKAHGMTLMVQDLTNPMLAQIPHVRLAAHAGTIMGVETNGMQFYPAASEPEGKIHTGLYTRRQGQVDLSTLQGTGFGMRVAEIGRVLPVPTWEADL